jgi:hypothetical protein
MKTPLPLIHSLWQRGYVSVLVVLALSMVVLVILIQSVRMSGTKALESQQYLDNTQALAMAESGMEIAIGQIIKTYTSTSDLNTSCGTVALGSLPVTQSLGPTIPGSFTYISATPVAANSYCKIRVKGTVGSANRTIETWLQFTQQFGAGGFGKTPTLSLNNTLGAPALAIFDLAWPVKGSDGLDRASDPNLNNNAYCSTCTTGQIWNGAKPGNGFAGAGYAKTAAAGFNADYTRTLDYNRNYIIIGMLLGGLGNNYPASNGGLEFINESTQSWVYADNKLPGCTDDNVSALVLGISSIGYGTLGNTAPPNYTASFDTVDLNGIITTGTSSGQWKRLIHFPNTDGSSPADFTGYVPMGDIFAEMYYMYKGPPVFATNANGAKGKNFFTVDSVSNLNKDDYIRVSGSTAIKDFTKITSTDPSTNTVYINTTLNNTLTKDKICSGLCGIIPRDPTAAKLTIAGVNSVFKGLTAGIACISNVDNNNIKVLTSLSSHRIIQWHEVVSSELP